MKLNKNELPPLRQRASQQPRTYDLLDALCINIHDRECVRTSETSDASVVAFPFVYKMGAFETRKLCYRKDDRAMRPIYGCRENLLDSLTTVSECRVVEVFDVGVCL